MEDATFKQSVCQLYDLTSKDYGEFILKQTLFHRVRFIRPFLSFFYPNYLFNEKRLVEKVGRAENLKEIQEEIDFYQHKYVVTSPLKDALKFRVSGMRLMSLANKTFLNSKNPASKPDYSSNKS